MDDEIAAAVDAPVDPFPGDLEIPEMDRPPLEDFVEKGTDGVMIPLEIDHLGSVAGLPEDLLDDGAVGLGPEPGAFQLPEVQDVPHEIEGLALGLPQKIQKKIDPAVPGSEVHVRDEDRPVMGCRHEILLQN
jgi:hypothetical protein